MAKTIEQEIADLEKAINSPATPDAQKGVMKGILEKLKAKQGSTPAPKKAETKTPAPKKPSTKIDNLIVAEVMYRDGANYKDNYTFGVVTSLANQFKIGDEDVPVQMFGFSHEDWQEFRGEKWDDEFDHYSVEVESITTYVPGMSLDNEPEIKDNGKWREALKGKSTEKKAEPKTEKKSSSEDDYDCDTLIEKEKTRRAKLKERALKKANAPTPTQATKNRDAIEKVGDKLEASIEKRLETGKVSKNELTKLIDETKALLKMLESYLDKVK
jgi:hypothetical protein